MVSCMCILRGRLSSTTKGPVTSPKEICPDTRSELIERILPRPPRAANTLASIWGAVWADAAEGSKKRSAMQSVLSLMESMVAADSDEWRVGRPERLRDSDEVRRGTPHPGCFAKRVWICLIAKELTFLEMPKRRQADENKGEVASDPSKIGVNEWRDKAQKIPPPPGFCMDVKRKGLREKGFVTK